MIRSATLDDLPELSERLSAADRVAIDTEFHAERRYLPALYLVQLRIEDGETWLLDPLIEGLIAGVAESLRKPTWILHGGRWDMEVLQVALGGLPEHVWDTQIGAALASIWWPAPYAALVQDHLGQRVDKSETLSDWSRRPLSDQQLAYAAADVDLLFPLWDALSEELSRLGRLQLAHQACDEARDEVVTPPPPEEAWRALRARAVLEPQQLAVLQEIAAWRRERAIAKNQPERSVLSDGSVLELARRQPLSKQALTTNRRLPRSLHKNAEDLLERIARAAQRPEQAWPRTVRRRTPQWDAVAWLEVWAAALGERESFAPGLVLPRRLLEDVVLTGETQASLTHLSSWRTPLVAGALVEALEGRSQLSLRDKILHLGEKKQGV